MALSFHRILFITISLGAIPLPKFSTVLGLFCLFICLALLTPAQAHAYIDPGTGSFVFQAILAAIVGAGVVTRMYWAKIKSMFGKSSTSEDDDINEE